MDEDIEQIVSAIRTQIFSNTSVEKSETRAALMEIISEIRSLLDALEDF